MKKNLLVLFVLAFMCKVSAQEDAMVQLNWLTDINQAKKESIKQNKPILIYFTGSDWCAPCKMLKEDFFYTEKFQGKSESFVLLLVDMPRRKDIITEAQRSKNTTVVRKYNKQGSYPTLVALNGKGNVLGELSGYSFLRETDRHYAFVDSILENF